MFEKLQVALTAKYPNEVRLLIEGGKLTGEWANVTRHCLIQAAAAEVMADLLGIDEQAKRKLASVAVAHDWKKRLERQPRDFSPDDRARANSLSKSASLDAVLTSALTPSFLPKALAGEATFLQLVQFYIDDITLNDEIVPLDTRVTEVEGRNPDPDPAVTKVLGRPYWQVERELGHQVERMLFEILRARHVDVALACDIPALVMSEIRRRTTTATDGESAGGCAVHAGHHGPKHGDDYQPVNTVNTEMTRDNAVSFILHQDKLMWSRIQTMQAIQLAGLASAYAIRSQPIFSIAIVTLTGVLTLLVFCLLRRDAMIQYKFVRTFPELDWSAPRRWHAPLKGREVAWVLLLLLLACDIFLGVAVWFRWLSMPKELPNKAIQTTLIARVLN
jgi:hypothetical protein